MINDRAATTKESPPIKDTYFTLHNLYCLLKVFALDWTFRRYAVLESYFTIYRAVTPALFIGSLNAASLYFKSTIFYRGIHASITVTDILETIYDHLQYIVDIYFVYKYGRFCKLEYLNYYKNIDRSLGFARYSKLRKEINRLFASFMFAVVVSSGVDFGTWVLGFGWTEPLAFAISYIYTLIKTLSFLDLMANILNVEYRLITVCDSLEMYYCSADFNNRFPHVDPVTNKKWIHKNRFEDDNHFKNVTLVCGSRQNETRMLTKCYLLLSEQCAFINKMFGIRILLNCISLLIDMIRLLNLAIRSIIGTQLTTYNSYGLPGVANVVRFAVCVMLLVALVHCCERSYRQRDRLLRLLDFTLINKNLDVEFKENLEEFRSLVTSRPLNFHLYNFCRLDYSLLSSVASVVVTYTIILSQN